MVTVACTPQEGRYIARAQSSSTVKHRLGVNYEKSCASYLYSTFKNTNYQQDRVKAAFFLGPAENNFDHDHLSGDGHFKLLDVSRRLYETLQDFHGSLLLVDC